jgi:hypothetical protein
VPAVCDHPDCNNEIDRGLSYVCGGEPFGGDKGCGLFFCDDHMYLSGNSNSDDPQMCERCCDEEPPYAPKPDLPEWISFKLTDDSWEQWRKDNPHEVKKLKKDLGIVEIEPEVMEF